MEEELKFKNTKLQNEVHCITNKISEFQSDCDKLRKEREKLAGQMGAQIELEKDYLRIKEENQFLISQVIYIAAIYSV